MKNQIWLGALVLSVGIGTAWFASSSNPNQEDPTIAFSPEEAPSKSTAPQIKNESGFTRSLLSPESIDFKKQWKKIVSEVAVDNYQKPSATHRMTMSISERVLPKEEITRLRLTPNISSGLKAVQQAAGITDKNLSLAVNHFYPPESSGLVTTRLQVFNEGIPVVGSELIVNQIPTSEGLKEQVVNYQIKNASGGLARNPKLPEDKAFEIATDHAVENSELNDLETQMESSRLVYFPGPNKMHLAWNIVVKTPPYQKENGHENPGRWDYMVDAETGEVIDRANLIQTEATTPQASGDGGNAAFPRPWVNELDVTLNSSTGLYETNTSKLITFDLKQALSRGFYYIDNSTRPYLVTGNSLTGFGNAAANTAHGFSENVLDMLGYFGYNSIDEKGYVLSSNVNPKDYYRNASWNGSSMLYAPEDDQYYSFSSDLGIVAHEIDHGFTQKHSNLRYSQESGGLNESFSDIAGVTAKFFMNQSGANFLVGERVIKPNQKIQKPDGSWMAYTFFRDMCNPTADGRSIDHWNNYDSSLGVHRSSGIMNKVFCRFAKRLASGSATGSPNRDAVLKAARVFYQANKTQWGQLSTFKSASIGTMQAATDLNYTASDIQFLKEAWNDVGIDSNQKYVTITVVNMDKADIVDPALVWGDMSLKFTCNSPQTQCSVKVAAGYKAEFRIRDRPGYMKTGISGCDSLFNNYICTVRADTDRTVTPNFVRTFNFYSVMPQNGTVRFTVNGIQYVRGTGTEIFPLSWDIPENTIVEVTATPDAGFYLQRFSSGGSSNTGCDSVSGSVCTFTMVANKTVVAEFARTVCTPSLVLSQSCTVPNGNGAQFRACNSNGSAWSDYGACTVTSCNSGFYLNEGSCLLSSLKVNAFELQNSYGSIGNTRQALIAWSGISSNDFPQFSSVLITRNGVGYNSGARTNAFFSQGYITASIFPGDGPVTFCMYLVPSASSPASAGVGNCANPLYSFPSGDGITQSGNPIACLPNSTFSQSCSIPNGTGTQAKTCSRDSLAWGAYGACTVTSCNVGYMNMGGNCSIPGPNDTAQLEPGRTAGTNPRGYFDGRTASGNFGGWVCQTNLRNSLKIRVYVGSATATKAQQTFVGEYIANQPEEAAVSSTCSNNATPYLGSRRFSIPLTVFGAGYSRKTVFVYGVKFGTTQESLLGFGGLSGYTNRLP
ncbi:MAG: hypothetical protein EB120_02570 [Proteobacteria bacterium]|nr:hypothetical protein [Pseudomonadota bacterium]NDG26046.1 hypothetical protein [Pseudomonadota bacterium]